MTTSVHNPASVAAESCGPWIPFQEIHEPGAYVSCVSGHLLRVPEDATTRYAPKLDLVADEPQVFCRISGDPFISLTGARLLASNLDLPVSF
jgi:hypothetical protein